MIKEHCAQKRGLLKLKLFTSTVKLLLFFSIIAGYPVHDGVECGTLKAGTYRKPARIHMVKNGETLYSISRRYGLKPQELCAFNKITMNSTLYAGTKLKIPPTGNFSPGKPAHGRPLFIWPVKNPISCKKDGSDGVKSIGIVIQSRPASQVFSSASGIVRKIGFMRGFGNYVMVTHSDRYVTVYSNLERIMVKSGKTVRTGETIGIADASTGKVHFQIDRAGRPADPLKLLPARG